MTPAYFFSTNPFAATKRASQTKFQSVANNSLTFSGSTLKPLTTEQPPLKKLHFLIVEDEEVFQERMCKLIKQIGGTAEICTTAEEALTSFRKRQPDIILMDNNLGSRMTGAELSRGLIQTEGYSPRKILFISSNPAPADLVEQGIYEVDKRLLWQGDADDFLFVVKKAHFDTSA